MKIKYKFYKSFKDIFCAYFKITKYELKDAKSNFFGKNEQLSFEEIEQNLKNNAWGFYDRGREDLIHIWWNGKNENELLETIAHEIGHAIGKSYRDVTKEENRAQLYADVTMQAIKIQNKIIKHNDKNN